MDLTLRDVFYWLIDTQIWEVTLWLLAIPTAIFAIGFLIDIHERFNFKEDGSERAGGNFLFWTLIIVLWVLVAEVLKKL